MKRRVLEKQNKNLFYKKKKKIIIVKNIPIFFDKIYFIYLIMILNQKRKVSEFITNVSSSDEKKPKESQFRNKNKRISKRRQLRTISTTKIENINFAIMISNLKKVKIQKYEVSSQYPTIERLMSKKGKSLKVKSCCKEFSLTKIHCKKNSLKKKSLNGYFFIRKRGRAHKFLDDVLN